MAVTNAALRATRGRLAPALWQACSAGYATGAPSLLLGSHVGREIWRAWRALSSTQEAAAAVVPATVEGANVAAGCRALGAGHTPPFLDRLRCRHHLRRCSLLPSALQAPPPK